MKYEYLKFNFLENEKSFQSETKNSFSQFHLLFRLKKQTSKNVADTTFKAPSGYKISVLTFLHFALALIFLLEL